uniref:Uncharacterized protein n=1 Tax=Avena sativa TaxID=4498 RepID=A0ACD6A1Q4_AVESA
MGRPDSNSGVLSARAFSIQSCVRMLHQNKRVAREEGLKDLVAALEGFACVDDHRYKEALDRCFYFLQNGSAKEKERKDAYRAIGLYALTVGPKAEQTLLDRLFDLDRLAEMVPSSPSDAQRAVAAIDCVAAATLACAKQPWEAERTLKAIWEVIQQTATAAIPQVLAAAVSAWTVVLPAARYIEDDMTPFVLIAKLLRADDADVRMAGGEALAVCIELDILPREPKYYYYYYYYNNSKPPEPEPDERPALESRVSELAFGVNARKKKAHAGEIGLFRKIDDFLKKNEQQLDGSITKNKQGPGESVLHGGYVVKVSRWAKLVQVNFLKYYIGKGFYTHFSLNLPLFRDSFGLTRAAGGRADKEDLPAHEEKQLRKHRDRYKSKAVKRDLQDKMQQYD